MHLFEFDSFDGHRLLLHKTNLQIDLGLYTNLVLGCPRLREEGEVCKLISNDGSAASAAISAAGGGTVTLQGTQANAYGIGATVVRVRNQKTLPFWEVETVEKALMRKAL